MIIGISGRKGSGKDLVSLIIKYLIVNDSRLKDGREGLEFNPKFVYNTYPEVNYQVKRFADKLKDMVCMLIGCTRQQLEDREFKEKELGEEWVRYALYRRDVLWGEFLTREEAHKIYNHRLHVKPLDTRDFMEVRKYYLTPRRILQLLGTDGVRNIIHPDAWVNALMSGYEPAINWTYIQEPSPEELENDLPNWLIPDLRFPNELKAIEDRKGITIRIERPDLPEDNHPSETALDDAEFDYIIENSGTVGDLVDMVKDLLRNEKIIK